MRSRARSRTRTGRRSGTSSATSCSRSSIIRVSRRSAGSSISPMFVGESPAKMLARHPPCLRRRRGHRVRRKAGRSPGRSTSAASAPRGRRPACSTTSPAALPAQLRAEKLQKRMASVGVDWDSPERVLDKIAEEAGEIVEARGARREPCRDRGRDRRPALRRRQSGAAPEGRSGSRAQGDERQSRESLQMDRVDSCQRGPHDVRTPPSTRWKRSGSRPRRRRKA